MLCKNGIDNIMLLCKIRFRSWLLSSSCLVVQGQRWMIVDFVSVTSKLKSYFEGSGSMILFVERDSRLYLESVTRQDTRELIAICAIYMDKYIRI